MTAFTTGTLSYVYFVPNSSLVTTNPVFNYSAPYTTTVTGVSVGSTTINVGGHDNASGVDCTNTMLVPVTVTGATPTPAPALPVGASVSKSCSNPGETVTFTMTYHDPRGWSDIAYAYLLLNSVNNARTDDSPKGALETILNVTTGQYQIRNQTDSAWLPFGTTTNGYATVAGLSYSGSGNTLTVTWSITFLSAWEKENANVYAQVTDRTTWIPSGFWDLNDFLVNGCATPTPTPTPVGAWWQVKDGDVWAKGSLASRVASGKVFLEVGNGGFPGVPSYTGSLNTGSGTVSTKGWNAVSDYLGTTYNYAYFENLATGATFNQINSTLIDDEHYFESGGTASADGYYWYQFDGSAGAMAGQDLTISSNKINLKKDRKTILLVKSADLYLNGDTDINNEGFFLVVVGKNGAGGKGSIVVGTGAKDLDGLFVADGAFKTNTNGTNDSQLTVTGAVAAGSFDLNRTLGTENKNKPAELFIYNPALLFYYPPGLTTRQVSWREIPP